MCWTYIKTIGHRAVTTGEGKLSLPCKPFRPPEKYVGHS